MLTFSMGNLQAFCPGVPLFPALRALQTPMLSGRDNRNLVMMPLLMPRLCRVVLFTEAVSSAINLAHLVVPAQELFWRRQLSIDDPDLPYLDK